MPETETTHYLPLHHLHTRLNLFLGTPGLSRLITHREYLGHKLSDHSSLLLVLQLEGHCLPIPVWRLNTLALEDTCFRETIGTAIDSYFDSSTDGLLYTDSGMLSR